MELQLQYARELLADHVNPYTKLSYCQDPTICLVELYDENGLFACQDKLGGLVPPYREELARKWNYWLRQRFADTAPQARLGGGAWQPEGAEHRGAPGGGHGDLAGAVTGLPGFTGSHG